MHLQKLELYGFKSFAERLEITFEKGITAIVGPNGSGKSNIADAVRWVLGEQSAKTLRGNKMEDVIFNGTEKRRALSYCEVSLSFDNSDQTLPMAFSEIMVTRRMYRSGESEYYINKSACRMKDIHELFRDTGIGRDGYSIIGQGRIDEILSNRSEDRRAVFEEAAGVVKYKVRKHEAERKLEHTRLNLERLEDIINELQQQIGPLEEQSRQARQYLALREELQRLELNVFLQQHDAAQERTAQAQEQLRELGLEQEEQERAFLEVQKSNAENDEKRIGIEQDIDALNARILHASTELEKNEGEAKVLRERLSFHDRDRERIASEHEEDQGREQDIVRMTREYTQRLDELDARQQEAQQKAEALQGKLDALDAQIERREEELERGKDAVISALNRQSDVKARREYLKTMEQTLLKRVDDVALGQQQATQAQAVALEEYEQVKQGFDAYARDKQSVTERYNQHRSGQQELLPRIDEQSKAHDQMQASMNDLSARVRMLEEMKRNHEGFVASVSNLLRDAQNDPRLGQCVAGVVGEILTAPQRIERAVEMALGPAMQQIITYDEAGARVLVDHLRSRQYGRATFLPIASMQPRTLNAQERRLLGQGVVGVASELLQFDSKFQNVVDNLLGRTVIVEDMDAGVGLARAARYAFRIVTLDGDILNVGGSITGGSVQSRFASVLGREGEIERTQQALVQVKERIAQSASQRELLAREYRQTEEKLQELSDELHRIDVNAAREQERVDILQEQLDLRRQRVEEAALEAEQVSDTLQDVRREMAQIDQAQEQAQSQEVTQEQIAQEQSVIRQLRQQREELSQELTEAKVLLMGLNKEAAGSREAHERTLKDSRNLEDARAKRAEALRLQEMQQEEAQRRLEECARALEQGRAEVESLTQELRMAQERRGGLLAQLRMDEEQKDRVNEQLGRVAERRHRLEMQLERLQSDLEAATLRIWEEYELTYADAGQYREEGIVLSRANTRVNEIRAEIRAIGLVNVNAIEDYQRVGERYEYLSAQHQDLVSAREDLLEMIAKLQESMRQRFMEQFAIINRNFSETFTHLFGGGTAELVLQDEDDVLSTGIDIIAQPPGKKLQLISLLSGGEKALTAIAILFAMLKLKPTPFCILDEIEAALDEANVAHYAAFLREYAQQTQFVVVSHRKGTMEASDALFGVAMEEKGISRMVSVRLADRAG